MGNFVCNKFRKFWSSFAWKMEFPYKKSFFLKFAWKNRFFLTRIHDPRFQTRLKPLDHVQVIKCNSFIIHSLVYSENQFNKSNTEAFMEDNRLPVLIKGT